MMTWEQDRQYCIGTFASLGVYVVSIVGLGMAHGHLSGPMLLLVSLVPSAAIACQLWVTLGVLDRVDEFVRAVLMKRFLIASGLAMIVATTWGFLETFAAVEHLPGWLIYPLFWAAFALVSPFIRTSH